MSGRAAMGRRAGSGAGPTALLLCLLFAAGSARGAALLDRDAWRLMVSGSYRNQADVQHYPYALRDPATGRQHPEVRDDELLWGHDLQRFLLMLDIKAARLLLFEVHYLHELDLSPAPIWQSVFGASGLTAGRFIDLDWLAYDGSRLRWQHGLDRLNLTLRIPLERPLRLTLGRQSVNFSVGRYWHAADRLAPLAPYERMREYPLGQDGVRLQAPIGQWTTLDLLYLAGFELDDMTFQARLTTRLAGWNFGWLAGWVLGDGWFAMQAEGDLGGVGLAAELAYGLHPGGRDWVAALTRASYRFGFGLEVELELYLNTVGASSARDYGAVAASKCYQRLEFLHLGRYYSAFGLEFPLLRTLRLGLRTLFAWQDVSAYINPWVAYAVTGNAEIMMRVFIAAGRRPDGLELKSEFGGLPNVYSFEARFDF